MNRVIYLIALETVFNNAIFTNQVRKLLAGLKRRQGDRLELTLLVLLPWIELTRRGLYSNFKKHRDELRLLADELAGQGIELVVSRTLFPSAFFNMKMPGLCLFTLLTLPVVWYHVLACRARLVHCRYYYASFVALLASKLSFHPVRVIFDVRTLLPEQGIVNSIWRRDESTFTYWKRIEAWMFRSADRVISVSPAMTGLIERAEAGAAVETIPNFVDLDVFRVDRDWRAARRNELGLDNRVVLLYSGTLGGRYPADRISECVVKFFEVFGDQSFFLVLTSSDEKRVQPLADALAEADIGRGRDWRALDVPPERVGEYLNAADWSLLVLGDFLTSETFLPVKFAEYLAVGLPVLTHPKNTGLVSIAEKYGIGAALSAESSADQLRARLNADADLMRERCIATASDEFSLDFFVERYAKLYDELAAE